MLIFGSLVVGMSEFFMFFDSLLKRGNVIVLDLLYFNPHLLIHSLDLVFVVLS